MDRFVDTHLHLTDEKYKDDLAEIVDRATLAGVSQMISMGYSMQSSEDCMRLAGEYDSVYAAVGVHPEEAFNMMSRDLDELASWAEHEKVVAIGEIGLDYYWEKDAEKRELQKKIFIMQLDLARQLNLPVCIHDREAHGDVLKILKTEGRGLRGVLHCFSGSVEFAKECVKLGYLLGIDGPVTYKNAAKIPDVVLAAGREDLLIETDSPYLTPVPFRGKRNEPAYVIKVAEKISEIKGISLIEVAEFTTKNAENLYTKLIKQ